MRGTFALLRIRRKIALVVACAVAATTASIAIAPAARADATVTGLSTLDTGQLLVLLNDPGALWLQITVRASTAPDAPALFTTDELTYNGGSGWDTEAPIQLPDGTLFGDYPVDVDYRLSSGIVQHWYGASHGSSGLLSYREHVGVVAATWDRTSTDYDNRAATLSGVVEIYDPATGDTSPAPADLFVSISWYTQFGSTGTHSATTSTAADGRFSVLITPGGGVASGSARLVLTTDQAQDMMADRAEGIPALQAEQTTVRLTSSPAKVRVHAGKTFRVSGTVQRLTPDGWQPLMGATMVTTPGEPDYIYYSTPGLMGSGMSDDTGHFSYLATAQRTTTFYTYVKPSDYTTLNSRSGQLYVPTAGSFTDLSFSIDAYRYVKVSGKLHGNCGEQRLILQYSKNGKSRWTRIRATSTAAQVYGATTCRFSMKAYGGVDGYYRVYHAESNQMLSVVSTKHRLHRILTRIAQFGVSPTSTYRDAPLTASGRVTQRVNGSWKALGRAHVVLVFRPKGDRNWYWVVKGYTTSTGHFKLKGKAFGTGWWGVYYDADAKHYYSQSKAVEVDVH